MMTTVIMLLFLRCAAMTYATSHGLIRDSLLKRIPDSSQIKAKPDVAQVEQKYIDEHMKFDDESFGHKFDGGYFVHKFEDGHSVHNTATSVLEHKFDEGRMEHRFSADSQGVKPDTEHFHAEKLVPYPTFPYYFYHPFPLPSSFAVPYYKGYADDSFYRSQFYTYSTIRGLYPYYFYQPYFETKAAPPAAHQIKPLTVSHVIG